MNVKIAVVVVMQKVLMFKIFIYNRHMDRKDFFDNKVIRMKKPLNSGKVSLVFIVLNNLPYQMQMLNQDLSIKLDMPEIVYTQK